MAKWKAWMAGLGDAVVDPGLPVSELKTVSAAGVVDGGGTPPLTGITIVQAETMEEVLGMVKACPHIDLGGSLVVARAMQMPM